MTEASVPTKARIAPETTMAGLHERSASNISMITDSYMNEAVSKGQFNTHQEASDALVQREAKTRSSHVLTINMSSESLDRFLTVGSMETIWDMARQGGDEQALGALSVVNSKDVGDGYDEIRRTAEDGIRQFAPNDALRHEPVYAALAGPSERRTGAAPSYGKFWLELDAAHADRAVYSFSDSLASVTRVGEGLAFDDSTVLDAEGAIRAKAVVDLVREYHSTKGIEMVSGGLARNANPDELMVVAGRRPGYVEGIVFDPITSEDVTVNMAIDTPDDMSGAGKVFVGHADALSSAKVYCGGGLPTVVTEWLAAHTAANDEAIIAPQPASTLWQELGVTRDAPYAEVAEAITRQTVLAYRDLVRGGNDIPRLASYTDRLQWDGYIKLLQATSNNLTGSNQVALNELIELQKARVFFGNKAN